MRNQHTGPQQPDHIRAFLETLVNDRRIHDIVEVTEILEMTLPINAFLCVVFHQKKILPERLQDDIPCDKIIFNYASFSISNGHVRRFKDQHELSDYIDYLQKTNGG